MGVEPFSEQGHYTVVHDAIFDHVMPVCPPNAWKVLCVVIRKTRGWKKESDRLSYAQIRKASGISSDSTVRKALAWLTGEGHHLLNAEAGKDSAGRQEATLYSLNREFSVEVTTTESEDGPTTVSVEHTATETVVGPATETVETITTLQEPHFNRESAREVSYLDPKVRECVDTLLQIKTWDKKKEDTAKMVALAIQTFPHVDVLKVCQSLAFKMETGAVSYKKPSRAFSNWVTADNGRAQPDSESLASEGPRIRSKEATVDEEWLANYYATMPPTIPLPGKGGS